MQQDWDEEIEKELLRLKLISTLSKPEPQPVVPEAKTNEKKRKFKKWGK
jgi:hypothetical protein